MGDDSEGFQAPPLAAHAKQWEGGRALKGRAGQDVEEGEGKGRT